MRGLQRSILTGVLLVALCLGDFQLIQAEESSPRQNKEIEGLVLVQDVDPTVVIDLRYATENNFTKKKIYPTNVCVLHRETAQKFARANADFRKDGYRLKIWDAYRPPYVQNVFWGLVPDERYVANPAKGGSRHNRGGAVDVTLVDKDGRELEMPSDFDDFSKKASPTNPAMSPAAKKNSEYLKMVMVKNGFTPYEHEWWHFDDSDWQQFPLVDVKLERFNNDLADTLLTWLVPSVLQKLDKKVKQAIVVQPSAMTSPAAKLTTWEFKNDRWEAVFKPMEAVLGRNGLAPLGEKREGDGRTPAGIYRLGLAFGYEPSVVTKLFYHQLNEHDFWVEDPSSPQYNRWVVGTPLANSFEKLKRVDDLYKYAVVIEYNTNPVVPGQGSAIFLHVWRGSDKPTAGCVAVAEEDMVKLLEWLDRFENPVVVSGENQSLAQY